MAMIVPGLRCLFEESEAMWIARMGETREGVDAVLEIVPVVSKTPDPMSLAFCPKCYEAWHRLTKYSRTERTSQMGELRQRETIRETEQ
jgi:hypothetical protein